MAGLYDLTVDYLGEKGLDQYEVSNFAASPETRSRHNQKYWTHVPYGGFGPSAHSFDGRRRSWNLESIDAYLMEIKKGALPVAGVEVLTPRELMTEALYLGLRRTAGMDTEAFAKRFQVDFGERFKKVLDRFAEGGMVAQTPGRCRLTRAGMRFADGIAAAFIDAL